MDPHRPLHPTYTASDAQNDAQHGIQDNSSNINATPAVEHPFVIQPSADSQAQSQELSDVLMDDPGYDSMPDLNSVDDSDSESDSDRDAHEVEMQAVVADNYDDDRIPALTDDDVHDILTSFRRPGSLPTPFSPNFASNSTSNDSRRPNRRARVDDDDDERDRRHPSQRVSSASNRSTFATSSFNPTSANSTPNQSATPTPPPPHVHGQSHHHPHVHRHVFHAAIGIPRRQGDNPLLRLYQHMNHADNNNNNGGNTPTAGPSNVNPNVSDQSNNGNNNNATPQVPPPPQPQQPFRPPQMIEGLALSFELGPGGVFFGGAPGRQAGEPPAPPNAEGGQQQANAPRPPLNPNGLVAGLMAQFLSGGDIDGNPVNINFNLGDLGAFGFGQEKDDPERAQRLVDGLEEVPVGLVRRLERVGGTGGGMGEDTTSGGDAGCAICWDKLLDGDGEGFGKDKSAEGDEAAAFTEDQAEGSSSSSFSSSKAEQETEHKYPRIVSLPCAHVFHADCLIPWFSRPRHTTCPTCRFNIDPDNLTYISSSRRRREQEQREREAAERRGDAQPATENAEGANNNNGNGDDSAPNTAADFLGRLNEQFTQATAAAAAALPAGAANATQTGATPSPGAAPAPGIGVPRGPGLQTTTIQTPQGTVNVIQVPIPIIIPVQVPVAAGPAAGAGAIPTPAPAGASATTPSGDAAAQQPPQAQAQGPQQQQPQGPGADFARFLSHLFQHAIGGGAQGGPAIGAIHPISPNGWQYMGTTIVGGGQPRGQVAQPPQPTRPQPQGAAGPAVTPQGPTIIQAPPLPPTFLPGFPFHAPVQTQLPPQAVNTPPVGSNGNNNNNATPTIPPANNNATSPPANDAPATASQQPPGLLPPVNPSTPGVRAEVMRYTIDMIFNGPLSGIPGLGAFGAPPPAGLFTNATPAGAQAGGAAGVPGQTRPRASSVPPEVNLFEGMGMMVDDDDDDEDLPGAGTPGASANRSNERGRGGQGDFGRVRDLDEILQLLADDEREEQQQADRAVSAALAQAQAQAQAHAQRQAQPSSGQQLPQPQPRQPGPQGPHMFHGLPPFLAAGGPGIHVASGSGRTVQEALAQVFAGFRPPHPGPQVQGTQPQPQAEGQQQQPTPGDAPAQAQTRPQQHQQRVPPAAPAGGNSIPSLPPHGVRMFTTFGDLFGGSAPERDNRPKRTWTLPPAPGPTLRQRIERKEREAGLRCFDVSCGVGPSDEEPNVTDGGKQVSIKSQNNHTALVCGHTFHNTCLVSAERVALSAKGAEEVVETEDGQVEVSCPVCRGLGCVSRQEWDEGVVALA